MRITLITTLNHNVGDDFIREGIRYLLHELLGPFEVELIHKHIPLTARPEWDWYFFGGLSALLGKLPGVRADLRVAQLLDSLPMRQSTDRILSCDVLIQCGAPVYWWHPPRTSCARAEWVQPLLRKRWRLIRHRARLLNLAGGTCQRYGSTGEEFKESPATLSYIRELFDECRLTTVRDTLSRTVLHHAGRDAPALPCTSIFARQQLGVEKQSDEFVALNFMPSGGHFSFGQPVDSALWQSTFVSFAERLAKRMPCALVCHNRREHHLAQRLLPGIKCLYSEDPREVLQFYSRARFGIVNRVHAAFAIASYGRPSLVIGTDTRAKMAEMIGLKSIFVSDATLDLLEDAVGTLDSNVESYEQHFLGLREDAEACYRELLKSALCT